MRISGQCDLCASLFMMEVIPHWDLLRNTGHSNCTWAREISTSFAWLLLGILQLAGTRLLASTSHALRVCLPIFFPIPLQCIVSPTGLILWSQRTGQLFRLRFCCCCYLFVLGLVVLLVFFQLFFCLFVCFLKAVGIYKLPWGKIQTNQSAQSIAVNLFAEAFKFELDDL